MQNLDQNQTQFSELTPIVESGNLPVAQSAVGEPVVVPAKPKSKKLVLVGVIGLILIVVFIFLLILIKMSLNGGQLTEEQQQQQRQNGNGVVNPLLEEIYDLDDQLLSSDPKVDEVPLPPVDMGLRLDPAKKKQ